MNVQVTPRRGAAAQAAWWATLLSGAAETAKDLSGVSVLLPRRPGVVALARQAAAEADVVVTVDVSAEAICARFTSRPPAAALASRCRHA